MAEGYGTYSHNALQRFGKWAQGWVVSPLQLRHLRPVLSIISRFTVFSTCISLRLRKAFKPPIYVIFGTFSIKAYKIGKITLSELFLDVE
jgi:hypothetical protein